MSEPERRHARSRSRILKPRTQVRGRGKKRTRRPQSAIARHKRHAMKHYASIIGAFIGGGIGAAIGESLHQPAVWLPLGIGIGLAIGIEIAEKHKRYIARS